MHFEIVMEAWAVFKGEALCVSHSEACSAPLSLFSPAAFNLTKPAFWVSVRNATHTNWSPPWQLSSSLLYIIRAC